MYLGIDEFDDEISSEECCLEATQKRTAHTHKPNGSPRMIDDLGARKSYISNDFVLLDLS